MDTLYKAHDNGGYHQKLKQQKMSDDDNDKDESLRRKSLLSFLMCKHQLRPFNFLLKTLEIHPFTIYVNGYISFL